MIGVTGANGYVGGRILSHLRASGADAIALVRQPAAGDDRARRYALGQPLDRAVLDGIQTVVHAAYDASRAGEDVRAVNACGSLPLLDGVAAQGGRVVMISTLSAFEGCRSLYGQAKLELEREVLARDGFVLRPGLVFGVRAGGMFGALVATLSSRPTVPLVGASQRLFITHDKHLCQLVAAIVDERVRPEGALFAAHEVPTSLRAIATQIAEGAGRRLRAIAVPSTPARVALRCAERVGLHLPFRSDSLRSLLNPIPLDQVAALARGPIEFPPLTQQLWLDR